MHQLRRAARRARGSRAGPRAARARPDPPLASPTRTAGCPPTSASSSSATRCSASSSPRRSTCTHPDLSEGRLAKLRAAVVNARALAERRPRTIGLGDHVKLGRGEESTGGRNKASILSDTVEAVIGAVHLSGGGIETSAEVVHLLFDPLIEAASAHGRRPGLEDLPPGALRRAQPRRPRVRHRGRGPRPHEDLHRPGARRRAASTATASAGPRRRPSRPPPRRRTARSRRRSASPTRPAERGCRRRGRRRTDARAARGRGRPRRPRAARRRPHHHPRRRAAPAAGTPRPARPGGLRRRADRPADRRRPPPRASTSGCRSTTATRCSATSA